MTAKKKKKLYTIHGTDILLNKEKLKNILDGKDLEFKELHELVRDRYKLDLTYKGFMTLLSNKATWKTLYSHAITETLGVRMTDVFDVVDVDVEAKIKEKEQWKREYDPRYREQVESK
jgi:hypothetical protein